MKKYLSYIFAAALTLGFTACEDVPAPYGINLDGNGNGSDDGGDDDTATGDGSLANPFNSVAANKYAATLASGATSDGTYYIKGRVASVKEEFTTNYGNGTFYISDDGSSENTFYVYRAYYLGNKKFTADDTQIEVGDSVVVCGKICNYNGTYETAQNTAYLYYLNGKTAGGDEGGDDEPITGSNLLTNSSFETWSGSTPEAWKSTTTASSATLSQSTDAHTGAYSVCVGGNETANKRLASKEYTLKAGTYKLSAYVKGAGQIRLGYVPVTNGKVGDYSYASGYTSTSADTWTEATYQFTLDKQTTVNFVLMNPKTSTYATASDKLVDDFTLATNDGGLVDDGGDDDDPTPSTGDYLNETFASGKGSFTIDDKSLPEGSTYVWTAASSYSCMKASSYVGGANLAAESWLISPEIDLTKAKSATLTFDQAGNYFKTQDNFRSACTVKVKTATGSWTNLSVTSEANGSSWTFTSATADLSAYAGQKIQIAFAYTSTTEIAGTWEVKNVVVK